MLIYRAHIPGLSTTHLNHLSLLLRQRRTEIGTRWRRLTPAQHALLVLAHLRCGDTLAQLAVSFEIGTTTVYRHVAEAVDVLKAHAPDLGKALKAPWRHPTTILDGTLIPTQRVNARDDGKAWYSGKHKRYGANVQAVTSGDGSLLWVSDGLPGSTHDLTAARHHQIITTATDLDVDLLGDKGYQGAGGTVTTPVKGRNLPDGLPRHNQRHNRRRARGERGFAILKTWRILRKVRSSVTGVGDLVRAIPVLEHVPAQ